MDADNILDEMANAFDEAWDLDTKTEDQLRAALRVLWDATRFKTPHVLQTLLHKMSRTKREQKRTDELWARNAKAKEPTP